MNKQFFKLLLVSILLVVFSSCSKNNVAGGSTDIEVVGVLESSITGGAPERSVVVTLLPESLPVFPSVDIPNEYIDTTDNNGRFSFTVPNKGVYTLYSWDSIYSESFYQNFQIDSSVNLDTLTKKQTANLFIQIPPNIKGDSGICYIPNTNRFIPYNALQDTITFKGVPSTVTFDVNIQSFNEALPVQSFDVDPILPNETDSLSSSIKVLYIIDTSVIKAPYPIDLGDSIQVDGLIEVTIKPAEEFEGADTSNVDLVYIASNVDHLVNTKWYPLVVTSKPVICASSEVYSLINLADNTSSTAGSSAMNATTISASNWNLMFPDSTINTDKSFNLFSSDTTQKYTVEWGVPNYNGKTIIQGSKPLFFYYEKGVIMPDDGNKARGIRVAMYGCNEQQFNSAAIQIIRNTIISVCK